MRASKSVGDKRSARATRKELHISGAEGIYAEPNMQGVVKRYIARALAHPKGRPDRVTVTVERLTQRPVLISTLPVATACTRTLTEARKFYEMLLMSLGLSRKAVEMAWGITGQGTMRGAAIIRAKTGRRLDKDVERGVRVSRLGIMPSALRRLSALLSRHGINVETVKEALILASKVASCKGVLAELCVSDDPCYTTGYVASGHYGYIRVPHIKRRRSRAGGRVFFVREDIRSEEIVHYLEKTPAMVRHIAPCRGECSLNEIIAHHQ
jgi:6-carboxyhexanoate--CoA ligase